MATAFPSRLSLSSSLAHAWRLAVGATSLAALLTSCGKDETKPVDPVLPAKISVPQAGLSPEGVQYDESQKHFLVSSRTQGKIGIVTDDSTYSLFADDPRLISTIGLHLDASRQRLFAAISDNKTNPTRTNAATQGKLAAVAIFNSNTGNLLNYVDLGALRGAQPHFANDIAVDGQGNAYITDSMSPIIYKVDLQGNATVFLEDQQLSGGTGFGLNGIVYHPNGYLLVAKTSDGSLFKVPLATPTAFTRVTSTQGLVGADGLLLLDPQTLLVVAGSQNTVFRMNSADGWVTTASTGTFATGAVSATTLARRSSAAYVLYPYQSAAPRFAIVKTAF